MNFRKSRFDQASTDPEINLIPFIDVLLVVLIFLMLTTTYSRYSELQVLLPVARADAQQQRPRELVVAVAADGRYALDRQPLARQDTESLIQALRSAASQPGGEDSVLVISADEAASHQSVIRVMEAARRSGLERIVFATRQPQGV